MDRGHCKTQCLDYLILVFSCNSTGHEKKLEFPVVIFIVIITVITYHVSLIVVVIVIALSSRPAQASMQCGHYHRSPL